MTAFWRFNHVQLNSHEKLNILCPKTVGIQVFKSSGSTLRIRIRTPKNMALIWGPIKPPGLCRFNQTLPLEGPWGFLGKCLTCLKLGNWGKYSCQLASSDRRSTTFSTPNLASDLKLHIFEKNTRIFDSYSSSMWIAWTICIRVVLVPKWQIIHNLQESLHLDCRIQFAHDIVPWKQRQQWPRMATLRPWLAWLAANELQKPKLLSVTFLQSWGAGNRLDSMEKRLL